jgi:hypothetical protein
VNRDVSLPSAFLSTPSLPRALQAYLLTAALTVMSGCAIGPEDDPSPLPSPTPSRSTTMSG